MFRKLSDIPNNLDSLKESFYLPINDELKNRWEVWLKNWQSILKNEVDFKTFCASLSPLLSENKQDQEKLDQIEKDFSVLMNKELKKMWANKLGLEHYNETLINEFFNLMVISKADYTILFRKLSDIPNNFDSLKDSFYLPINYELNNRWEVWLENWQSVLKKEGNIKAKSALMKSLNPVYTWREWMVVPAYEEAEKGN